MKPQLINEAVKNSLFCGEEGNRTERCADASDEVRRKQWPAQQRQRATANSRPKGKGISRPGGLHSASLCQESSQGIMGGTGSSGLLAVRVHVPPVVLFPACDAKNTGALHISTTALIEERLMNGLNLVHIVKQRSLVRGSPGACHGLSCLPSFIRVYMVHDRNSKMKLQSSSRQGKK